MCREKGTLLHCWWESKFVQPLWKRVWRLPRKIFIQKDTCTPMFIAELFEIVKTWKPPRCPSTDEWIKM